MNPLQRITLDPTVMGGKPCIRGLRVTVGTFVGLLAAGRTEQEILKPILTWNPMICVRPWPMPPGARKKWKSP